jgi:hypothetical protein
MLTRRLLAPQAVSRHFDWLDRREADARSELARLEFVISYREQVLRQSEKLAEVAVELARQRISTLTLDEQAKQAEAKARIAIADRNAQAAKAPAPPPDPRLHRLLELATKLEKDNARLTADNSKLRRQLLDDEDEL